MTVSSSTNVVILSADGSTHSFAFTFKIFAASDLKVIVRSTAGVETEKTLNSHYIIADSSVGNSNGGNVLFKYNTGTSSDAHYSTTDYRPASGEKVILRREIPQTQELDLVDNDPFSATLIEEQLDKVVMQIHGVQEAVDRSLKFSRSNLLDSSGSAIASTYPEIEDDTTARANKVLSFDSTGLPIATQEIGTLKGDWAASTIYQERDIVKDSTNSNVYIVNTAHTSSGSTPLSSNANASKYTLVFERGSTTVTVADNSAAMTLISTDTDASEGPLLDFTRNPGQAGADNDYLGAINFKGYNDAPEVITFAKTYTQISSASDGSEGGNYTISSMVSGTERQRINVTPYNVTINEENQDLDFVVQGVGSIYSMFMRASDNKVAFGTGSPTAHIHLLKADTTTAMQLETTDSGTAAGPILNLTRTSLNPLNANETSSAANDYIGKVSFRGINSSVADVEYANIGVQITSTTASSEAATITIDSTGDIALDADGGDVFLKDAGTQYGALTNTSGNLIIKSGSTTSVTFAGANSTFAGTVTATGFIIGSADINENDLEAIDGVTAGTVAASKVVTVDTNKDFTGARNITLTGELDAGSLDVSGDADIAGTTNLDNTDIDGTLVVDGSNISLDSTSTLNIDNSNTSNGITIGTATSGVPVSIGHSTSEVTINDNLNVTGNFTVSGTTTTVNSTVTTVVDPILTIGSNSTDDNKDRGLEFKYNDGSARVGFFGYDDSASAFTVFTAATNSSEVFSGTTGNAIFGNITGTLQTAAQGNITSLGTLTTLTVDNVIINGSTIGHTGDTDLMTVASGVLTVAGEVDATSLDISGDADIDGTLEAAAITIGGTAIGSIYSPLSSPTFTGTVTTADASLDGAVTINGTGADKDFIVQSASNSSMLKVDAGANFVGIGTGTYSATLSVNGSLAATTGNFTGDVNIESATPVIYYKDNDGTANNYGATYFDTDTMYIYTRNGSSHGALKLVSFNGSSQVDRLTIDASGNATFGGSIAATTGAFTDTVTVLIPNGGADNAYAMQIKNEETTDDRSYGLLIHAGSTDTDRALVINDHDGSNPLFQVHGNGRVGIGTTSANNTLDVNGGIVCSPNTDGKDTFELSTNDLNEGRLRIKNVDTTTVQIRAGGDSYFNGGRVGIGGVPTLGKLDIGASDSGTYAYFDDGTNTLFQFSADTSSGIIQTQGTGFSSWKGMEFRASEFIFKPANSEKMRINGTGVGIGITPLTATTGSGTGACLGRAFSGLTVKADDTRTQAISIDSTNAAGPNFMISTFADGSGSYYMLGANLLLDTGGDVTFENSNENMSGIILDSRAGNGIQFYTAAHDGSSYVPAERIKIDSSGRVGINETNPSSTGAKLTVNGDAGSNAVVVKGSSTSGNSWGLAVNAGSTSADASFRVYDKDGSTAYLYIRGDGKTTVLNPNADSTLVVKNTNASQPYGAFISFTGAAPDNNAQDFLSCSDTSGGKLIIYSDGDVVNHDNSYGALSDERIKQDIVDANSQWDDIKAVKVRNFKRKDDVEQYADKAWTQIGVIAQELETVSPKLIKEASPSASDIRHSAEFGTLYEDGDTIPDGKQIGDIKEIKENVKKVSYSVLYMKAIKALQEAMTRIETLEAKVTALQGG